MSEEQKTISGSLGIDSQWFDDNFKSAIEIWNKSNKISDFMIEMGEEIKEKEFDTDIKLSQYEKKLILISYAVGYAASRAESDDDDDDEDIASVIAKLKRLFGNGKI